ncbi:MAG: hypothetical protein N2738_06740 [Thermodesulfovibrionales bacterium]|nr:hypothetical protein [Thermodesulfovibrionales bacterium]
MELIEPQRQGEKNKLFSPQRHGGGEVEKRVQGLKGSRGKDEPQRHGGTEVRKVGKRGSEEAGMSGSS